MHQLTHRKKSLLKRCLAAALSTVMLCTALPLTPYTAQAAAPYVSLRTRFKTLQTGQSSRMTLKNNTAGWKITKVATADRTIAMVYGRTEDGFMIKGKSVGRTTVRARLKTTSRKKHTSKLVKCRVNVTAPKEQEQLQTQAAVSSQEELLAALAQKSIRTLTIQTPKSEKLTIPKGMYTNVALTVDAPAADIENYGVFQSVTIQSIKPDTWTECAVGNTLRVLAQAARIVVEKGARLKSVLFAKAEAKAKLEINGAIDQVTVSEKTELEISGSPENVPEVSIEESASGTVLVSKAPVNVTLDASADITFQKGAEKSTVICRSKAVLKLMNETTASIKVTKPDGSVEMVSSRVPIYQFRHEYSESMPTVTTPTVTTKPAVTPTGPAVSGPGNGSGDEGAQEGEKPVFSMDVGKIGEFLPKVIKAETAYAVSKQAVKLQGDFTVVTASGIVSFQLREAPQALPEGVYVEWSGEGLSNHGAGGWERLEGDSPVFTLDEYIYVNKGIWLTGEDSYIGPVIQLRFQSDTMKVRMSPIEVILPSVDTNYVFLLKEGEMYYDRYTYMKIKPLPLTEVKWLLGGRWAMTPHVMHMVEVIEFQQHEPVE